VFLALFALTFVSHPCIAQISPKASLKERLAQFITNPPDIVQFAKDKMAQGSQSYAIPEDLRRR
jgi:hypothetical protein